MRKYLARFAVFAAAGLAALAMAAPADAYIHEANCRAALVGANGDNDIQNYINAHRQTGWSWGDGWSQHDGGRADRVSVSTQYFGYPNWSDYPWGISGPSYCMGSDANITDTTMSPPAGW